MSRRPGEWIVGWVAASMPVVAVVVFDPLGWFPFGVAKWAAVVLVSLLTIASAALVLPPSASASIRERVGLAAMGCLVGVTLVSALAAVDGLYAWIGTPMRHLGALAWVLFALMFASGRRVGCDDHSVGVLMRGFMVAALALGVYSGVEIVHGAPVDIAGVTDRLGGPFGSAAYLGAACCLVGPAAVAVAIDRAVSPAWRLTGALAAVLVVVALFGSGSRAAVVGVFVAGVLIAVARFSSDRSSFDGGGRVAAGMSLLVGVVAVGAWSAGVFDRSAGWGSRLDEWRLGAEAIAEHPIVGVGPEGYRLVVGGLLDADYVRRYGETVSIDRAHSGIIDVSIASGVLAGLCYAIALAVVVWSAVRLSRQGSIREVGASAGVIAYAVQQQFLFPIAELEPSFWLLAGVVVVRSVTGPNGAIVATAPRVVVDRAVAATALVFAVFVAVVGVRVVAADRLAREAAREDQPARAVDLARRAVDLAPSDVRYRLLRARSLEQQRTLTGVDQAIDAVDDALAVSPLEPVARLERSRLLSVRAAITGTDRDRTDAARAWGDMIADSPACARCHLGAALAALERGDETAAGIELRTAADLGDALARIRLEQLGGE